MKRKMVKLNIWVVLCVAVVILLGIFLIVNFSKNDSGVPSGQNNGGGTVSDAGPKTYTINITGYAFQPKTLRINAGDSVIWTNRDNAFHEIVSDTGLFNSGAMTTGKTFKYTFTESGMYQYHCDSHPYMKGAVAVE